MFAGRVYTEKKDDKPWIDFYYCRGCLKCKPACPSGAVGEIIQPCNGKGRMSW
ncbi:MAG: 4Fe-4S binding protein [Victivallaceae bacterium]